MLWLSVFFLISAWMLSISWTIPALINLDSIYVIFYCLAYQKILNNLTLILESIITWALTLSFISNICSNAQNILYRCLKISIMYLPELLAYFHTFTWALSIFDTVCNILAFISQFASIERISYTLNHTLTKLFKETNQI